MQVTYCLNGSVVKILLYCPLLTSLEQTLLNGDLQEYTDICFPSASENAVLRRLEMVQGNCFFDTKRKHVFDRVAALYFL